MTKQKALFKIEKKEFGGSLLQNKRKELRPLSPKCLIHLIFKADITESKSLLRHRNFLDEQIKKWSQKFHIEVCNYGIEHAHIHMAVKINTREDFNNFSRTLAAQTAKKLKVKWIQRPYTNLIPQAAYQNLHDYIHQNSEEALGLRPYSPRKHS